MTHRLIPVPATIVEEARAAASSLTRVIADEPNAFPCRACLRDAEVGERLLLFSYRPIPRPVPYQTMGPIFVHEEACVRYAPPAAPAALRRRLLALRAYDAADRLVECELVEGAVFEELAARLFEEPRTATIHVHFARAGCWACALERPV